MFHISVLLNEVLEYLRPKPGDKFIDATFSGGGHSSAILERIKPGGKILGIELDTQLYQRAKEKFSKIKEIILVNDNYRNLKKIVEENFLEADPVRDRGALLERAPGSFQLAASNGASGILLDLGVSSWHLEESGRGFSFQKDEPLDMRFDEKQELTAREIVNSWPPEAIERILKEYGEERFAGPISRAITKARRKKPILGTFQLVETIKGAVPVWYVKRKINPATKTFQALRIAVNDELGSLEAALKHTPEVLKTGGRAVIISFHSLEDRIVKNAFRDLKTRGKAEILTKKPIRPSAEEVMENPRSRSAKLRVLELK